MRAQRPLDRPLDRCVTGPHETRDEDGQRTLVWRCGLCGTASTDPRLRGGCWNCDNGTLWR